MGPGPKLLSCRAKCLNGYFGSANEGTQRTLGDFIVRWNGKCSVMVLFDQDDMAATLTNYFPTKGFEDFYDFTATEYRQARH